MQRAISRIKVLLRKNGEPVEDEPNDKAPRRRKPTQSRQVGDVISGDKVGGDKVMHDKNVIIQPPPLQPAIHQLRAPVADFVGREDEAKHLVQIIGKASSSEAVASISAIRGMGGIGKTELAYVIAQRLTTQFPDAQLLVELRGASHSPLTPEQALQVVIRAFEREAKLPDDLPQLQGIYRSILNGKRVLILADDAKDVAQIRPLMPPSRCALVVTSRNRFNLPGMLTFDLEILPSEDAEKLLLEIAPRIGGHAGELAKLCGYLPLALRVSASLLETNNTRDVAVYLEQLRIERLKYLKDPDNPDDPQASVEASLRLSYDALEPKATKSILCQLSIFPRSFGQYMAQEVAFGVDNGIIVSETLEILHRRSLLDWDAVTEEYSIHDLVRIFSVKQFEKSSEINKIEARLLKYILARQGMKQKLQYAYYLFRCAADIINVKRHHLTLINRRRLFIDFKYYQIELIITLFELHRRTEERMDQWRDAKFLRERLTKARQALEVLKEGKEEAFTENAQLVMNEAGTVLAVFLTGASNKDAANQVRFVCNSCQINTRK